MGSHTIHTKVSQLGVRRPGWEGKVNSGGYMGGGCTGTLYKAGEGS